MKFNYQARTKSGDIQAGTVEAASQEAGLKVLQEYGLIVTFFEKAAGKPFYSQSLKFLERVTRKDLVLFSRELSTLFKSEVSLIEALRTLAEESKNQSFKEKILKISEAVEGGMSLSDALALSPEVFSSFYVNLVKSGEISGKLSDVLSYLADHLEREYALTQKLLVMMIYPAFIFLTFIGVLVMMMVFVIPKLVDVLSSELEQLPLLTRIVIGFTNFFNQFFLAIIVVSVSLVLYLRYYVRTPNGKKQMDRILLKIPLVSEFLKMVYLSRLAENLSTLVSGGLNITRALEVTADVIGSSVYREIVLETREEVRKGEMISKILKKHPDLVPPFFSQMVMVGEKTGRLSESLLNIVGFYSREIERSAEGLMNLLEPLMIIILGGLVGVLIAAVLLPLYQMGGSSG